MPNKCPICFNYVTEDRGNKGSGGLDPHGSPLPFWTEDSLLTPNGLAGTDFKGLNPRRVVHIQELQEYYVNLGETVGQSFSFTSIDLGFGISRYHICELRKAVEDILEVMELTIADYFKFDRRGEETPTFQTDWTDVDRSNGYPEVPIGCSIRAIHIEELRRGTRIFRKKEIISNSKIVRTFDLTETWSTSFENEDEWIEFYEWVTRTFYYAGSMGEWCMTQGFYGTGNQTLKIGSGELHSIAYNEQDGGYSLVFQMLWVSNPLHLTSSSQLIVAGPTDCGIPNARLETWVTFLDQYGAIHPTKFPYSPDPYNIYQKGWSVLSISVNWYNILIPGTVNASMGPIAITKVYQEGL